MRKFKNFLRSSHSVAFYIVFESRKHAKCVTFFPWRKIGNLKLYLFVILLICVTLFTKQYYSSQYRLFDKIYLSDVCSLREYKYYCKRTNFVILSIEH